jgi:hypothetical protein
MAVAACTHVVPLMKPFETGLRPGTAGIAPTEQACVWWLPGPELEQPTGADCVALVVPGGPEQTALEKLC